ncbi:hypothetical protein [Aequorivita sp. Q41]|uniref:hypothetical protein n=1 Tax=Aequorivita sp. Q41 TaxID=3153300 RepID=UPI0032429239
MGNFLKNLKFIPKPPTALGFILLLLAVFTLFQGRKYDAFKIKNIDTLFPGFYSHISNFAISYLIFAGIGYFWLMAGVPFKFIIALGIVLVICNFSYELFINILNTTDIIDAYYGLAGTIVAYLFLHISYKYGFKSNTPQ